MKSSPSPISLICDKSSFRKTYKTFLTFTLLALTACGGGGGTSAPAPMLDQMSEPPPVSSTPSEPSTSPSEYLSTPRFTTHQPAVLEQVGAHHAYARGLTGKGVRIGVEDDIVDYTQTAEFGDRVKLSHADGAVLTYSRPFGDVSGHDIQVCRSRMTCDIWVGDSEGDNEAINAGVRQIVSEDGWPTREDSVFMVDEHYSELNAIEQLFRWHEVPALYSGNDHGTIVASVAAGKNLGIAPEATIIPIATNFDPDDQDEESFAGDEVRSLIASVSATVQGELDDNLASTTRENYAKFDIINRSFGTDLFDPDLTALGIAAELRWWRQNLPKTLNAEFQVGTPDAQKTIFVYAAGNEGESRPLLEASFPYYIPEVRGYSLAVAATDPSTGRIADYSNYCGPLPSNWDASLHGRHFCLTAPGTVRGLVPNRNTPGKGTIVDGIFGTSFAAPIVSGALALLMEHFRGTRGNTAIVKRMIDTADRTGPYANSQIYGAGFLDIAAALMPVGTLNAGQSALALSQTALQTPAAFGSVARRATDIELATFDEQDFPFWIPLSGLIHAPNDYRSLIPQLTGMREAYAPAAGLDALGLHWVNNDTVGFPFQGGREWTMGLGSTSVGLAYLPRDSKWSYGLSLDHAKYLGAQTSGAFGSDLHSGMIWTSRAFRRGLGEGWALDAEITLATSVPQYEDDAIFSASPSMMSAMSMRIGNRSTGLTIEQPLRAESGTGTFRIENGRMENGRRLYDEYRISLRPDAREVRMTLRHEQEALGGALALEAGHSMNHNHVAGASETRIGLAYRTAW